MVLRSFSESNYYMDIVHDILAMGSLQNYYLTSKGMSLLADETSAGHGLNCEEHVWWLASLLKYRQF